MLDATIDRLGSRLRRAQQWLFEQLVQPLLFGLGLGNLLEDGFEATGWLLVGLLQLLVIAVVFGALQRWRPVEPRDRPARVRVDILYTLVHRLGRVPAGAVLRDRPAVRRSCSAS